MVEQVMDLIEGTVIELIDLVEPVHYLFCVGGVWIQFFSGIFMVEANATIKYRLSATFVSAEVP